MEEIHPSDKGIKVEDLIIQTKDNKIIVAQTNLSFKPGEVTAIIGPSGSGKTTIILKLLGYDLV